METMLDADDFTADVMPVNQQENEGAVKDYEAEIWYKYQEFIQALNDHNQNEFITYK